MKKFITLIIAGLLWSMDGYGQVKYGLDRDNGIYLIDDGADEIHGPYRVTGLADGQLLVQFDISPDNDGIYALAYDDIRGEAQLYRIDVVAASYSAMPVGNRVPMFLGSPGGVAFSFNPAWENVIMVSANEGNNNYLLDAETGRLLAMNGLGASAALAGNADMIFYPNPVLSQARINLDYPSMYNVYVDIVNLSGQIVRSYNFSPGSTQLDLDMSTVPIGLYNVRVVQKDKGITSIKVVRE